MANPDFDTIVQQFIYDTLSGVITATVYDYVPMLADGQPDAAFPYVTIGNSTSLPDDNDSFIGCVVTATIDIWSRAEGSGEVKGLLSEIYHLLHRVEKQNTGSRITDSFCTFKQTMNDPNINIQHGVMRFAISIEKWEWILDLGVWDDAAVWINEKVWID